MMGLSGHCRGLWEEAGMDEDEGIKFIPSLVVIIALALFVFVILGFAAYSIFLFAMWLVGRVW